MSLNGTDAVAVATIVGAAALTFIGANALFGSHDSQSATCSSNPAQLSLMGEGHRIEIHTGSVAQAVIIEGELSAREGMKKRRRRRHRHPHRATERRGEFNNHLEFNNLERCLEAQLESQLEQVEAEIEVQMRAVEVQAVEARVQAELSKAEAQMERLRFRVRVQEPH